MHHFARPPKKEESFGRELLNEGVDHALGMFVGARELQGFVRSPEYTGPASFGVVGSVKKAGFRIAKGEVSAATLKATNEAAGELFGYPAYQVEKTMEGTVDLYEGKTRNPAALLFGPAARK